MFPWLSERPTLYDSLARAVSGSQDLDRPSGQAIPLQVDTLWDERHKAIEQKEKDRLAEEQVSISTHTAPPCCASPPSSPLPLNTAVPWPRRQQPRSQTRTLRFASLGDARRPGRAFSFARSLCRC